MYLCTHFFFGTIFYNGAREERYLKKQDDFIMLPTVDFCFKELMENSNVRRNFIAALFKVEPEEIQETKLLPTVLGRNYPDDKQGILDVRVLLFDGTQVNLEVQVKKDAGWNYRAMFYDSKLYVDQIKKKKEYKDVKKSIQVGILDFIHSPGDDRCYRTFHFRDDETGELLSDRMEIQILELRKIARIEDLKEDIQIWMKFFSGKNREELMAIAEKYDFIKEAYDELEKMSADEIKRAQYEAREMEIIDFNSKMGYAEERGREQGLQNLIIACRSLGATKDHIIQQVVALYHLTVDEATEKVNLLT